MATDPRAPFGTTFTGSTQGGPVSFEVYFLRDLFQRGKIDQKLVEDVMKQNGIQASINEVMDATKDTTGKNLPLGLVRALSDIALVIAENN